MRKFLGYLAIAAVVLPTVVPVSAEPPPADIVVVSSDAAKPTTCDRNCQPQPSK